MRRTYATCLAADGIDITVIRENMGHASVKTTEKYIILDEKRIRNFTSPLQSL